MLLGCLLVVYVIRLRYEFFEGIWVDEKGEKKEETSRIIDDPDYWGKGTRNRGRASDRRLTF